MAIKPPTPAQLAANNMAPVPNLPAMVTEKGDHVRTWNGKSFILAPANTPYTTQLYAVPNSWVQEEQGPELYLGGSALGQTPL